MLVELVFALVFKAILASLAATIDLRTRDTIGRPARLFLATECRYHCATERFKALVDFMDANAAVGIAGSRLEDPDGTPQRSAFRFKSPLSRWNEICGLTGHQTA